MKQFDSDQYDEGLKSLDNGVNLSEEEQNKMIDQINTKIGDVSPKMRQSPKKWRYYLAFASAFLVITILSLPQLSHMLGESTETTVEEMVERHYEAYNNKDFETFFDMLSTREQEKMLVSKTYSDSSKKELIETIRRDKEEIIKMWEKSWRPVEVIKVEEQSGATEESTTVAATLHYPARGTSPEATILMTFKVVKENGEWKFDEVLSSEPVN
ncbi:hypothetical protein GCM10008967_37870 [Bacillus carboniphilus]|uniref:SnoaL-like domain-containing protein n=1 Tax=Bacillus carboniphilus TaxID=86663 RepID=A0ABN0WQ22_9BACI